MFSSTCRRCGFDVLQKSRFRFYEWPLIIIGFRPVRCRNCNARFYAATQS